MSMSSRSGNPSLFSVNPSQLRRLILADHQLKGPDVCCPLCEVPLDFRYDSVHHVEFDCAECLRPFATAERCTCIGSNVTICRYTCHTCVRVTKYIGHAQEKMPFGKYRGLSIWDVCTKEGDVKYLKTTVKKKWVYDETRDDIQKTLYMYESADVDLFVAWMKTRIDEEAQEGVQLS